MKLSRHFLTCCVVAFLCICPANSQEPLNNDSVIKMVKASLSEDIVVSMVNSQPGNYSVTPDHLIALKSAGVSDKVVEAMVKRSTAPVSATGATPAAGGVATGDPNDPTSAHDSGIYLYAKNRDGNPEMVVLERANSQATKTGMGCAFTYGIKKCKTKAVIPGPAANIRTGDSAPVFYFYFEDKAAGLGKSHFGGGAISNPNQFALIRLDVVKSARETTVGEFGLYGGSSTGTDSKSMIPFKSERVRSGLYKVVPSQALTPGQYCFLSSGLAGMGAATATDLFDFGVNPNQ